MSERKSIIPENWPRDIIITIAVFIFGLFALLSAGYHSFSIPMTVLFVFAIGSVPWIVYNVLAHLMHWERSHLVDLFWYWLDVILSIIP